VVQSTLERPINKAFVLDWEKALYILLIVLALATRLWGLGDRVQSHDESIHTKYSWHLYTGQGFSHHPLMHGPFLFHVTALSYFLFGDNDFSARVPVALMGVLIVAFPYLLRRWLGRKGALVASFFLLISPSIAYYSRYIRHDIPAMLWALVIILAIFAYIHDGRRRSLFLMAAGVSLMFASKEVAFIYAAICGLFLIGAFAYRALRREWPNEKAKPWFPIALLVVIIGLGFFGASQFSRQLNPALEEQSPPTVEEQPAPPILPGEEQVKSPWEIWSDVMEKAGIALTAVGLLSAATILLLGHLTMGDLPAITPVLSSLVAAMVTCLLILVVDRTLGILFTERWTTAPDWLAVWGRILLWIALLVGEVIALTQYLTNRGLRSHQLTSILLIILVVTAGTFIRLGLPALRSFASCRQPPTEAPSAVPYTTCIRAEIEGTTWLEGGTLIPIPFLGDLLIDTRLVLTVLPFASGVVAAFVWLYVKAFRDHRAFDLAIVLGTLCLPFLSPLLMVLAGLKPLDYKPPTFYYTGAMAIQVFMLSIAMGLMWDLRRRGEGTKQYTWLVAAVIHYAIFVAFFTTFLTNAYGIASGSVGSLGYWWEQQEVERGGQPWYYYILMVGIYEYLPLLLAGIAPIYLAIRAWLVPYVRPDAKPFSRLPGMQDHFVAFMLWWIGTSWLGYSAAGEKMPWLTVHLALPMILLGAWLVGRLLEEIEWRQALQKRTWLLALLVPPLAIGIGVLVDALAKNPFAGYSLTQLQASGRFVNALLGIVACSAGVVYVMWRSGWRLAGRILLLIAVLLPVFLTARTAWHFAYINYDYATEFLVYAHGAPGVREAVEQIEEISQRYGGGPYAIEVPYGADGSTFFHWQLRYYEPDHSFGESPSGDQLDAPVIIAARAEWDEVDRYAGDDYTIREYIYIWWPMQDYWNLTWERIRFAITDAEMRAALWDVWYNRDYAKYDAATGKTHTPDKWPLRGDFRLYIRNDVAEQIWDLPVSSVPKAGAGESGTLADYASGWRDLHESFVFGSPGPGPGQLQNPRGIQIDQDGFVYVADGGNQRIQKFSPAGEPLAVWDQGFREPWDVAAAPDGDSIYVADTWNHQIQHLDMDGTLLNRWGIFGEHTAPGNVGQSEFYGPRGIAIAPTGNVYVADTGNKRVQVFDPQGKFSFLWGGGGSLSGYLEEPVGIAIGPDSEVYVADTWNRRVQVFTSGGAYLREWPIEGWDASRSEDKYHLAAEEKPYLAIDSNGFVYVTDPSNFRVLVFDSEGNYVLSFGKQGTDAGSFLLPTGIAVAQDGTIYVADAHRSVIAVYEPLDLVVEEEVEIASPKLKYPAPGSTVEAGSVTLVGTGHPDSKVRVLIDGDLVETVVVDLDGAWVLDTELDEPGEHTISLQGLEWSQEAGLDIAVTSKSYTLTVKEKASSDATPDGVQAPTLDIDPEAELVPGEVELAGTGRPNASLLILIDDQPAGTTVVDGEGNWLLTVEIEESGMYQVVVQELDADGEVVAASEPTTLVVIELQ
jgi:predicted membrane-bound mannosyltransferase/DNA-binding beta-propeller fold protein YncE